jgi:hypothetical protein
MLRQLLLISMIIIDPTTTVSAATISINIDIKSVTSHQIFPHLHQKLSLFYFFAV